MDNITFKTSQYHEKIQSIKVLPPWFRQKIPNHKKIAFLKKILNDLKLHTVCQSALCPNLGQCWSMGVATFMILGQRCTRACRFCAVKTGEPFDVDPCEPEHVAKAVKELQLNYVVITSVTRDDLLDKGVGQFIDTIKCIRCSSPKTKIEVLIPDFDNQRDLLEKLICVSPDVIGHNIEMVKRLFDDMRPQAKYHRSLSVLKCLREFHSDALIKSGFMVGLGETKEEIVGLMQDLIESGCELITIGQYLAPSASKRHVKEERFVSPDEFEEYRELGLKMGFRNVFSGPLVRSSYLAEENYNQARNS